MLEGEISQINLVERLVELWREQFTGAIRFENDGIIKILYFKGGDVLSASTNDRDDSIDEILMRAGKVSREHVKQALAKRKESETLGDALLNLGFITRKELAWARRVQAVGVIRSISEWEAGSFTIVADYLPKRDEGTLFPLPQIIVELIVTDQDRGKFEGLLDGGNAVFTRTADFDKVWPVLGLNEDAEVIVAEIDGERNASEIAVVAGKEPFNTYKLLHGLATLGIIARSTKAKAAPQLSLDDFSSAGVADAADMWGTTAEPPVAVTEGPSFELDDSAAPSLDLPPMAFDERPLAAPPAFQEETDPGIEADPPTHSLPAWDAPVRDSMAVPIQAPIEPPAEAPPPVRSFDRSPLDRSLDTSSASDEQWGFDEAQLETASRSSSAPPPIPPPARPVAGNAVRKGKPVRRGRSYGLIIALMIVFILAAAGYFGFLWWQEQQGRTGEPVIARPVRPAPTTTVASTTTPDLVGTVAPEPVPGAASTAAPDGADVEQPLPVVVPATAPPTAAAATPAPAAPSPLRARLDAQAREYAANPSGNFTIQIQILCDPGNLDQLARSGGSEVWFVPQTLGTRPCYRVFYGRYGDRAAAQRALAQVPAAIRDSNAAVRPVPR